MFPDNSVSINDDKVPRFLSSLYSDRIKGYLGANGVNTFLFQIAHFLVFYLFFPHI